MWYLECFNGRQVWKYIEAGARFAKKAVEEFEKEVEEARSLFTKDRLKEQNSADRIYRLQVDILGRGLPKDSDYTEKPKSVEEAARRGIKFWQALQHEDGHWPADYGGPMFLMPGLVFACYYSKTVLSPHHREEMIRYLVNHQNEDGGWGLHIESHSTVFGTGLNYVALRLLGMPRDKPCMATASRWLKFHGGAVGIPSWGKFWLATLNLFDWSGMNPISPELWLAPYWFPLCPGRMWCHSRIVYLPMSYCYGARVTAPLDPLLSQIREEIFVEAYDKIQWPKYRDHCAPCDVYTTHSFVLKIAHMVLNVYEKVHFSWLRKKALAHVLRHIHYEDEQTKYICIGPVNKTINFVSVYHEDPKSKVVEQHRERLYDYLWLAEDGMKMQGYNGSQLWDCAFAVQAIIETGLSQEEEFQDCLKKAYKFIEVTQVREDAPGGEAFFRHISKGAWPFSTRDHGWPISDCTSEGLKATLLLHTIPYIKEEVLIDATRLEEAVNVILSLQSVDGGWATYEQRRGSYLFELLNPSEVFGEIMVDYPCVECTSACTTALCAFQKRYPSHRKTVIRKAIDRGIEFIKTIQRKDGSWMGSWAVCFNYGIWFGMQALVAGGEPLGSKAITKACQFLISKQRQDGGWGESYLSCVKKEYVQNPTRSQHVDTAWALLALMIAQYPDPEPIERGIKYLMQKQRMSGDWEQEGISGVFNRNCMITYTTYRNTFPIWALGRYLTNYHPSSTTKKSL